MAARNVFGTEVNATGFPQFEDSFAAPDSWFSHLAVEVPGENGSNEWLEAVTDDQYGTLK